MVQAGGGLKACVELFMATTLPIGEFVLAGVHLFADGDFQARLNDAFATESAQYDCFTFIIVNSLRDSLPELRCEELTLAFGTLLLELEPHLLTVDLIC